MLSLIGWLIGLGVVVALWQRPSSAFFSAGDPFQILTAAPGRRRPMPRAVSKP